MVPRLIALSGPARGTSLALTEGEEVTIGREQSNRLCISDASLSRRHCLITNHAGQIEIRDLHSSNGTFVNGVPVQNQVLNHGDRIAIGDSVLLLLLHEGETALPAATVELNNGRVVARSTIQLRSSEALYLHPEKVHGMLPPTARVVRNLNSLLKISTVINSTRSIDALQQQLLEMIFEVVPAERGAILLAVPGQQDFSSVFARDRRTAPDQPVQLSRTILNEVLRSGVAILCNDVLANEPFSTVDSLVATQISSLLCVPMILFEKVIGIIYLDTSDARARFDEDHLQLVTAIAAIAAVALENARHVERLENETKRLQADLNIEHNMVGDSPRMRQVYKFIAKVAPTDSTILIRGESGTGKELAARAIHHNSPRAQMPFVAINCAVLSETLLESELFGHEKGAFTGAITQKKGKLEIADGGTLFLDEVGEMAPTLQAKLLRVLQEREFERVGGTRSIKVDIRLIAATNKDLAQAVRDGEFRQDLYYRLNVVSLTLPPLRERREDIPLLANYFVAKYSKKCKRRVTGVSPEARACLMAYDWPGNVRELENAIERAVVLGSTELILPDDLPDNVLDTVAPAGVSTTKYHDAIIDMKKGFILRAFEQAGGNHNEAAKILGIHPNNLHRLIKNLDLKQTLSALKKGGSLPNPA